MRDVICWAAYHPREFSFGCGVAVMGRFLWAEVNVGLLSVGVCSEPEPLVAD